MNIQDQPKGSRERTLDEVKAEFMRRAGKLNPFEDIKREDAETRDGGAEKPRQGSLGRGVEQDRARLRGEGRRRGQGRRKRQGARRALHARASTPAGSAAIRRRRSPGKLAGVSAFAPHVPQGGEAFRSAARDHRSAVRRQEARRLSAEAAGRHQAAGRHALGRRRRLEGRPPEDRQDRDGRGPRLAHHRHAGHRREPGAVRRSRGRAHLFRRGSITCRPAPTSTASASRSGAAASAPTGRRGSPSPRPTASRARCSTAATCITASSANGSCRPSPPAARPICSARRACSKRAAARWA